MEAERPAGRFAAVTVALAALAFFAATVLAARAGEAGRTILGGGAAPIEAAIALGGTLVDAVAAAMAVARAPALAVVLLGCGWWLARPASRRGAGPLLCAISLGWIAQSYLISGQVALGAAIYLAVLAAAAVAIPQAQPREDRTSWRVGLAIAALLGVFAVACLYRLDVLPNLYVDEMAYLRAARMFAGQIDVGRILGRGPYELYVYDQFAAQTLPIALQAAAISLLPSDVVATRLLSFLAVGFALVIAVLTLRRALGDRVVVWMLALGATAPLLVVYSRTGFYISVSILHGVASFAALLWLLRRWDARAAAVVGVLLGGSLYQYQLSWFVPVFAVVGFAVMPELWRRAGVVKVVGTVAVTGALCVLPGLIWLDTGIDAVNAQTFDRAVWNARDPGAPPSPHAIWTGVLAVAPPAATDDALAALVATASEHGLTPSVEGTNRGGRMVWIGGLRPQVRAVVDEIRATEPEWLLLDFDWINKNPVDRFQRMLSQLFYTASWESSGRWVAGPLFNPALAPLLVVGLVLAWRRRAEPVMRLLLVWVIGGALLPAVFGGPAPRRTSLMLPFAYAVMALPLVDLGARLARGPRWRRTVAGAAAFALALAVLATGAHRYFRNWEQQAGLAGGGGEILDFVKVLKTRPADEVVLAPAMYRGIENYLDAGDASRSGPEWHSEPLRNQPLRVVRELSCRQPPPFSWIARDTPEHRAAMAFIAKYYDVEPDDQAGLLVRRATAGRSHLCSAGAGRRGPARPRVGGTHR